MEKNPKKPEKNMSVKNVTFQHLIEKIITDI